VLSLSFPLGDDGLKTKGDAISKKRHLPIYSILGRNKFISDHVGHKRTDMASLEGWGSGLAKQAKKSIRPIVTYRYPNCIMFLTSMLGYGANDTNS
jgi:hypothetical protein